MQHESQFNALVTEIQADEKLEMIGVRAVRYAGHMLSSNNISDLEAVGLTRQRWAWYQKQLRELGVVQVFRAQGEVSFKVDDGSILNGDSYKGYEYSLTPPSGHRKATLDEYRIFDEDRDSLGNFSVYKPLKGNWYLYLFVNR